MLSIVWLRSKIFVFWGIRSQCSHCNSIFFPKDWILHFQSCDDDYFRSWLHLMCKMWLAPVKQDGKSTFWPLEGTAVWPLADSGHRPSTSAATQLRNTQRADAGVPESRFQRWCCCSGPGLVGSVWTGLTRDADDELTKRKVRYSVVMN